MMYYWSWRVLLLRWWRVMNRDVLHIWLVCRPEISTCGCRWNKYRVVLMRRRWWIHADNIVSTEEIDGSVDELVLYNRLGTLEVMSKVFASCGCVVVMWVVTLSGELVWWCVEDGMRFRGSETINLNYRLRFLENLLRFLGNLRKMETLVVLDHRWRRPEFHFSGL